MLVSCGPKQDPHLNVRMRQWDRAVSQQPEIIRDSLQKLDPSGLSDENKAYYGLLKTISDDKTYVEFTSDSLIAATENYYRNHDKASDLHIRSLIYLGIVRSRLGKTDSTALIPLKEAGEFFYSMKEQDASTGYLLNFFLGFIHGNNNNLPTGLKYLEKSLQFAKREENAIHLFDAYLALFWNCMKREKWDKGREYLDSLEMISGKAADENFFLLNAQSSYYYTRQMYRESIEKEKEQLKLAPYIQKKPEIFRIYYSISTQYFLLNQLDSAEVYALKAIECVLDPSYSLNYLLYENVADIAESKNDYRTANHYRKQAAAIRDEVIEKTTDTQVLELEKRYDLSRAENKALQAEAKIKVAIITILCLFIVIVASIFYIRLRRISIQEEKRRLQEEKRKSEADKKLAEARADILRVEVEKQQLAMKVYHVMLRQFFASEKQLQLLADKSRKTKPDFADFVDEVRSSMNKNLIEGFAKNISDSKFYELTGISLGHKLNKSELLMLFLIFCGVSNKNLATVFRTSAESIRSRKSQLKNKLLSLNINISFFEQKSFPGARPGR